MQATHATVDPLATQQTAFYDGQGTARCGIPSLLVLNPTWVPPLLSCQSLHSRLLYNDATEVQSLKIGDDGCN
jgi:hypothetical protein